MQLDIKSAHASWFARHSGKKGTLSNYIDVSRYTHRPQDQAELMVHEILYYASRRGCRELVFRGLADEVRDAARRAGFFVEVKRARMHVIAW